VNRMVRAGAATHRRHGIGARTCWVVDRFRRLQESRFRKSLAVAVGVVYYGSLIVGSYQLAIAA